MARYTELLITLSAGQAAGTTPILPADSGGSGLGTRSVAIIGNPTAKTLNLFLSAGGAAGAGMPLAAGTLLAFDKNMPGPDIAIYVVGGAAGDTLSIWTA